MDNKAKNIFDAKNQIIDSNLKNEVKRIKRTYAPTKHFSSLEMNQRIAIAETQAAEARKFALWELEQDLHKAPSESELKVGKLIFYINGQSIYVSPSDKKYEAEISPNTNSYKLLNYLIANPYQEFDSPHLAKFINNPRTKSGYADDDRRVRDTIQEIRVAFGLTKKNKRDDFFKVNGKRYGIWCEVEIKQSNPQNSSI